MASKRKAQKTEEDGAEDDFVDDAEAEEEEEESSGLGSKSSKKVKNEAGSSASAKSNGLAPHCPAGEHQFKLSDKRFIHVRKWKKFLQVDIREFYESQGELKHGKAGISLSAEQWAELKKLVPAIDAAIEKIK